jgi:tetratricopeptide (TPR) repeat protein
VAAVALTLITMVMTPALLPRAVWADAVTSRYDRALLPTDAATLRRAIKANSRDPVALCQLVRQADAHKLVDVAYHTLNRLRLDQPDNAVAQAAYCLVFDVARGEYRARKPLIRFRAADYTGYVLALRRAYELDPKLWLTYAVEGHTLSRSPDVDTKGLALLKKAVSLAPDLSITHHLLAEAYTIYQTPFQSFDKAAEEYNKASQLQPVLSTAPLARASIYCVRTPDKARALLARKEFLATVPPGYQLRPQTLELLRLCSSQFDK